MKAGSGVWWALSIGILLMTACGSDFEGGDNGGAGGSNGGSAGSSGGSGNGGAGSSNGGAPGSGGDSMGGEPGDPEAGSHAGGTSAGASGGASGSPGGGTDPIGVAGSTTGEAGAGAGGAPPVVTCGALVPAKSQWTITASHSHPEVLCEHINSPDMAIDSDTATRYTSGKVQSGNEWLEIDFGEPVTFNHVVLDSHMLACSTTPDYARQYAIRVSSSAEDPAAELVASGEGDPDETVIELDAPVTGRYMRILQTGSAVGQEFESWWSVVEIDVGCE